MGLLIKPTPAVEANKWEGEPIAVYVVGLEQDFTPMQALEFAADIAAKATKALAGGFDHHWDDDGEEIR